MGTGLALSRRYWEACGLPALQRDFPTLAPRAAAGLIGEGSECFGYDDAQSRDHDWGPGFCLWFSQEDLDAFGPALQAWYAALPAEFEGFAAKRAPGRVGVFAREAYFARFIGPLPQNGTDWLRLPESYLAVCTNGEVFYDPEGVFSQMLSYLRHCPEPVRQKKLAARCVTMMQAGQYNFPRCIRRGETFAARLALGEFVNAAASAAFLLNGRWQPFYKWMPRALGGLPRLAQLSTLLEQLLRAPDADAPALVEAVCAAVADELRAQGLTALPSCDMQQLGLDLYEHLTDPQLRALPVLAG